MATAPNDQAKRRRQSSFRFKTEITKNPINPTKSKEGPWWKRAIDFFRGPREEDEVVTLEEELKRRYELARSGWKKVRKALFSLRFAKSTTLTGKGDSQVKNIQWLSYDFFVVHPNTVFARLWKMMMGYLLFYNNLIVPYRSFFEDHSQPWLIADYIFDALFLTDVVLNFFFAYFQKTRLIKEFRPIAMNYIKGWFFVDVACLVPYYWISTDVYYIRLARVFKLFRMLDGIEQSFYVILSRITSKYNIIASLSRIINFVFLLLFVAQVIACIWYRLGTMRGVDEGVSKTDGWITRLLEVNIPSPDLMTKYITSIYWVFTTLSTVGYGDYVPFTTYEYSFAMAVEFIGVFLFAYAMGNINNLVQKLDDDHIEIIENEKEQLDQWIMKIDNSNPTRKLQPELIDHIKEFFLVYWQKDHTTIHDEYPFLAQLPIQTKHRLIHHLFGDFLKRFNIFFDGLEEAFKIEILVNLYPRKFEKDGDIIEVDTTAKEVYFITKGVVTICSKDGVLRYLSLPPGTYFGEHLVFFKIKSSNAFMALDAEVECMCITKEKFLEICDVYPKSAAILRYKAYLRRKEFRKVKLGVQAFQFKRKGILEQEEETTPGKKSDPNAQQGAGRAEGGQQFTDAVGGQEGNEEVRLVKDQSRQDESNIELDPEKQEEIIAKKAYLLNYAKLINEKLEKAHKALARLEMDIASNVNAIKNHVEFLSHFEEIYAQNA